jgi:hypothetical protein
MMVTMGRRDAKSEADSSPGGAQRVDRTGALSYESGRMLDSLSWVVSATAFLACMSSWQYPGGLAHFLVAQVSGGLDWICRPVGPFGPRRDPARTVRADYEKAGTAAPGARGR